MKLAFICFTSLFLFANGQTGRLVPLLGISSKSFSLPQPPRIRGSLTFGAGSPGGTVSASANQATLFTAPSNIPTLTTVHTNQPGPIPAVVFRVPISSTEERMQQDWNSFRSTFNKVYSSPEEEALRREIFFENRAKIDRLNEEYSQGKRGYVQRLNPFADLLLHEFTQAFNGYNRSTSVPRVSIPQPTAFIPSANVIFPKTVDWREVGAVTGVKSQGKCAACWAFAAAGALESHTFRKTGKLVEISAQNLIDCTEPYGNSGCSGGLMNPAFEYVRDNKGVDSEESYPYEEKNGECRFRKDYVVATCTGYVDIAEGDEKGLEIAIATLGPVTAAIDAGQETFQFYSDGIYDDPECGNKPEQMNHAVLIVGYGQDPDGRKYWLVKNSYGPQWGMGGYLKMAKDKGNQCGIAIQASYPLV